MSLMLVAVVTLCSLRTVSRPSLPLPCPVHPAGSMAWGTDSLPGHSPSPIAVIRTVASKRTGSLSNLVVSSRSIRRPTGSTWPPPRATCPSWPGLEIIGDQRVMIDFPSQLPEHLVAASISRRLVMHAMHSVVDWLAFAMWEDGRLVRSLSLSPDSGIIENIGEPLSFELPYWAGDRPADVIPWPDEDEDPYPLPFHPLELGEDALRALCGFVLEGRPEPDDIDADSIRLHGFRLQDPHGIDPAVREAALQRAMEAMGPPRFFSLGPDGSLIERGSL
ncbi:DUF6928 family protein [Streptomyces sp. NPDC003720]|uniref:DUF6928 family protein n=1 Tax=Streptomyces sp. NPDC003720 TaxID=3364684 RepID=UPI00367E045C